MTGNDLYTYGLPFRPQSHKDLCMVLILNINSSTGVQRKTESQVFTRTEVSHSEGINIYFQKSLGLLRLHALHSTVEYIQKSEQTPQNPIL